jgi:predicted metal-dependent peptidase
MEQLKGLKEAQEALSIVTTLLLSPGSGASSPKTFYAHFLMRMNTIWCDKTPDGRPMKSAGVSVTDKLNLYINPEYFNSLSFQGQMDLLEHEIEHIIYLHPLRSKDYIGEGLNSNTHMLFNYATDANINENKQASANKFGWVTIDRLNEQLKDLGSKDRLNANDPAEVHYEVLKRNQVQEPDNCGTTDDHSTWGESTDNQEVAKGIIQQAANQAASATGAGNMPEGMLRAISNLNKATVNWKRELRQFATNALRFDFERTRNRRNRRYGIVQPGRRKRPKLKIAACNDSSGSVSDEAFAQYFAELGEIAKMDVEVTVIDADCVVQNVYDFDPKKPVTRTGYGGTAYQPAIDKAMELNVDAIVYFGDMDSADKPTDPGVPFLWAVVGPQNPPGDFGKTVRVIVEKERY